MLRLPAAAADIPVPPLTQLATDDGIPDLVLRYEKLVVVVEAKTGSDEHHTPSGKPQTLAYPLAVQRRLGLSPDTPVHTVFLTPDRRPAENSDAICTSYLDFAIALASAMEPDEVPEDLRATFKMLLTHLALNAVPHSYNSRPVLREDPPWLTPDAEPGIIPAHLLAIHNAVAAFLPLEPS